MDELRSITGTEVALDEFHGVLRRVAAEVRGISAYGSCLVTCSDERQGSTRTGFDRDVAAAMTSSAVGARDRVFAVSNMCGRLEPGALALVDDHFSSATADRETKLLVIEIASHVGRMKHGRTEVYGRIGRLGRPSPCCGALTSLLNPPSVTSTVRHPWFEQLNAFFGPVRLAALRARDESTRMIAAAVVHAVLQAESAVADIFDAPPRTATHVLLAAGVTVNQDRADGFVPVAFHHLQAGGGGVRIIRGFSLRTTPEALHIDVSRSRIEVAAGDAMESAPLVRRRGVEAETAPGEAPPASLAPRHKAALESRLDVVRDQVESVRHDPVAWRTYARPILRGLFRGLCVAEPEVDAAALLYEGGRQLIATHKLKRLVAHGPSTPEGRRVLHDIEAELQQLNHEDAQNGLDILLASKP